MNPYRSQADVLGPVEEEPHICIECQHYKPLASAQCTSLLLRRGLPRDVVTGVRPLVYCRVARAEFPVLCPGYEKKPEPKAPETEELHRQAHLERLGRRRLLLMLAAPLGMLLCVGFGLLAPFKLTVLVVGIATVVSAVVWGIWGLR